MTYFGTASFSAVKRFSFSLMLLAALLWTVPTPASYAASPDSDDTPLFVSTSSSKAPVVLTPRIDEGDTGGTCVQCGFGDDDADKVSVLELTYLGAGGFVEVYDNADDDPDKLLFSGALATGDVFTIDAATIGEDKFSSKVGFWVDGTMVAEIHTSCSDAVGPGTTEQTQSKGKDPNGVADFQVESGQDKDGVDLCAIPPPPPGGACEECDGKVTTLTLRYNGAAPAQIRVEQKKNGDVVFDALVNPGETFSFVGTDKGTLGTEISIFVDNVLNTKIHTSCSQDIGPGLTFGDFLVVAGASKNGGPLCPLPPSSACGDCDGKVTQLTLRYDGAAPAQVRVEQKKGGDIIFDGVVNPGETFSFIGTDKKGTMGTEIKVFVDGSLHVQIHTSCSQPIGPGLSFGDFTVVTGASRNGGRFPNPGDTDPPTVAYSFSNGPDGTEGTNDDEIRIDVADATGIASLIVMLEDAADPNATPNLFIIENTWTPGATSAFVRLGFTNFTDNTLIVTSASDGCLACPDFIAPVVANPVIDIGPPITFTFPASDETGLFSVFAFRNTSGNFTQISPPLVPGATAYDLVFELTPPGGALGMVAADQCNAFVFDDVEQTARASRMIFGIEGASDVPVEFALEGNYPNPFNPQTQISFSLPQAGEVRLAVYDVLGRLVQLLAQGQHEAGRHAVTFDASGLPSGTYFYRLDAAGTSQVRQMMLAK